MLEYVVLALFAFAFYSYKKKKSKRNILLNHSTFLQDSFKKLEEMKTVNCTNTTRMACIKLYQTELPNIYTFTSDGVKFDYKQSYLTIVRHNQEVTKSAGSGFVKLNRTFNLKVFGFKDVVVSTEGSIHSQCWDVTTAGGCVCKSLPKLSLDKKRYAQYDKVITITHHWGNAVYHSIGECLPKLGYYIPELLQDNSIKIHAYRSASLKYLYFLGFNGSRVITGSFYAKRLLSLEKGGCGSPPPIIYTQSLRNNLRSRIKSKPIFDIVLIKRLGSRDIVNFNEVHETLKKTYKKKKIVLFYPNTTFPDTLNYFKYAKLIVAPHGAGLSNMVLSEDCRVVEFVGGNLCLTSLGRGLGLEYYGLYQPLVGNRFVVNITSFKKILAFIKL